MIRVERDPTFWERVASHPALAGSLMGLAPRRVAEIAATPSILPLASANGGFLFGRLDGAGLVLELHTLFTPEGWGREVHAAGKEALARVFRDARVVVTHEVAANARSRPPRSFGFALAGDWKTTALGALRAWVLSQAAWEASPARRRFKTCP